MTTARPFRGVIEEGLADELAMLFEAWLVPFELNVLRACASGRCRTHHEARILGGLSILRDAALAVSEVLGRSAALRSKSAACCGNAPLLRARERQ
ncbi:hypothetical protein [Bradyrhizobium niftali]|uniref:Uncharacterized protein n=1 Tax=Bradyrhizobium niftali TaxID=2560055 RepID=A0A4Y9L5B1_9BRAD|nr:hypothetical protein [Bradyrhizobium niftali]TFV37867.1 hypothetical protein E4K65_43235 [Bradyrhizobium niftali]